MIQQLCDHILRDWRSLFASPPPPELKSVIATGSIEGAASSVFVFVPSETTPILVVKAHRIADSKLRVEREFGLLQRLRQYNDYKVTTPRPLFFGQFGGIWCLAQEFVAGRPMRASGAELSRAVDLTFDWLRGLYPLTSSRRDEQPRDALTANFRTLRVSDRARRLMERAATRAADKMVLAHDDFCPQNVLVTGASIAIVDWTDANLHGNGLHDVFSFFAATDRASLLEAFPFTTKIVSRKHAMIMSQLEKHCSSLKLPTESLADEFVTFLASRSLRHINVLRAGIRRGGMSRSVLELARRGDGSLQDALNANQWTQMLESVALRTDETRAEAR